MTQTPTPPSISDPGFEQIEVRTYIKVIGGDDCVVAHAKVPYNPAAVIALRKERVRWLHDLTENQNHANALKHFVRTYELQHLGYFIPKRVTAHFYQWFWVNPAAVLHVVS